MSMQTEVFEIESRPNSGFERFTTSAVTITDEVVEMPAEALDSKGRRVVAQFAGDYEAVKAIARISWKTSEDRQWCIEYQRNRSRWAKVESYAEKMRNGEWDYARPGPVFIHPRLISSTENQLKPVNGARRIMAHLEAGHDQIEVLVLRPSRRKRA